MSDPNNDRPNGGDGDEDGGGSRPKNDWNKQSEHVGEKQNGKSKRVSLFRFRKVHRRNKLPSSNTTSCCFLGKRDKIGGYCLCFNQTPTEDFHVESRENDQICSGYRFESLRTVIEKNDFFCKESNTHLEINAISTSNRFH